jgi:rare lipoprotein A
MAHLGELSPSRLIYSEPKLRLMVPAWGRSSTSDSRDCPIAKLHITGRLAIARIGAALGTILLLTGCLHRHRQATVLPSPPTVALTPTPTAQLGMEGLASWYGGSDDGRPTASGETYNMYAMTAAHRTLPFGTMVRVHDLDNGRSVDVRINDRGPFVSGRVIDLSYAAAQDIDLVGPGTAHVQLEILNSVVVYGPAALPGIYAVQVGAFRSEYNAQRLKAVIEPHYGPVQIQTHNDPQQGLIYRVRVGQLTTEGTAEELAGDLRQSGLATQTFVVRLN